MFTSTSRSRRHKNQVEEQKPSQQPFFAKSMASGIQTKREPAFFQARLSVNKPGDKYEQEADAVASAVVNQRQSTPAVQQKKISSVQRLTSGQEEEKLSTNDSRMRKDKEIQEKPEIQRMCSECEKEKEGGVQRMTEPEKKEKEKVQKKSEGNTTATASASLSGRIENSSGNGRSLPAKILAEMSSSFGSDFSHVHIHTDTDAVQMNKELSAQAFTHGRDIYFNSGKYNTETSSGRELLAHELTHVIQQTGETKTKEGGHEAVQRAAIHQGNILDEGSCEHLACNSKWACDDPNGVTCPKDTRNAGETKRALFYCDKDCKKGGSCSDTDKWMALPNSRIKRGNYSKCGMDLVICANGKYTHATVVDRSEREAWEVSHGVQDAVGVSAYGKFKGAVYGDETDKDFTTDKNCNP